MPKPFGFLAVQHGFNKAVEQAKIRNYLSPFELCKSSDDHYKVFESLRTGKSMLGQEGTPKDCYRSLFNSFIMRNASMAHKVHKIVATAGHEDTFFICCSISDMAYGFGVPERIWDSDPTLKNETCLIYTRQVHPNFQYFPVSAGSRLHRDCTTEIFGHHLTPGDFNFIFDEGKDSYSQIFEKVGKRYLFDQLIAQQFE